jgi:1,4-dihydroxy-2-naphthoate octaprenyltransferase
MLEWVKPVRPEALRVVAVGIVLGAVTAALSGIGYGIAAFSAALVVAVIAQYGSRPARR